MAPVRNNSRVAPSFGQTVTEAPAVSPPPALPLGWTGDGRLQASATTPLESTSDKHTPEAVAPSPLGSISDRRTPEEVAPTPFGSTSDRPMEVLSDEEETKLNVKPSRILMRPPETNYKPQEILDEESKKLVIKVQSLLVRKLLTYGNDVKYMVCQANTTLRYLKGLDVDYGSFYQDVKDHIKHRCDLQDAEREETTLSLSALQKNYEHAIHSAGDVGEDITHTQEELEKAKEKKETLKRKIEDLRKEVAHIEHEEERRKREETKYKEAHEVAKAKIQELGIQLETAQAKLKEIEQRKNTALRGIESSTQHLQSKFLDDLK
ncbi:putative formin-like protein 14-like isoform X1 [Capsicum annuum]|nr:putative formin-like protein 14-like isoform X1 [Capsicum annuum]